MPWKYTEEYYREYTRTTWNESSEAYLDLMHYLAPFRADLVQRLAAKTGERILDLGTGPGEPAMTLSEIVGETGSVVGVDLSDRMIDLARAAARSRGLSRVEFQTMDCGALTFGDASFDAAVSNFGFQIFTDPEKAAREAHRVLRPGGRIAVSVWGTADRVPLLHAIMGPMLEHAEPDETGYLPTPYETGGPGEMVEFLHAAGFRDAREERCRHLVDLRDEEEYLRTILTGTPIGHSLAEESAEVQAEVLRKTRANLQPWRVGSGLSIPAECAVVTAHRPG
jgi:SAM-dependent methyltransferase